MANKPAPVTDAEAETWQGIYQDLYDGRQLAIRRLLADRTRDKERIEKLEEALRCIRFDCDVAYKDGVNMGVVDVINETALRVLAPVVPDGK